MDHRRSLKKAVRKSKLEAFKELRDSADNDIWGKSYRLIMTKVKGTRSAQPTDRKIVGNIVSTLFSEQNNAVITFIRPPTIEDFIPISEGELLNAAYKMNNNKAPGPDGIPNVAVKVAIKTEAELFVNLYKYKQCLVDGIYPKSWFFY